MNVSAGLMDLGNVYLQRRGDPGGGGWVAGGSPSTHLGSRITAAGWNLFTQLWGSAGPGEGEDVFRASLIMAAWEEINRAGPAGMLQLLPPAGGGGAWSGRGHGGPAHRGVAGGGGICQNTCCLGHICAATRACKSTYQVWPDADGAPGASARTRGRSPSERARLPAPPSPGWDGTVRGKNQKIKNSTSVKGAGLRPRRPENERRPVPTATSAMFYFWKTTSEVESVHIGGQR